MEGDVQGVGIDVRGDKHIAMRRRTVFKNSNSENLAALTEPPELEP